MFSLRRLKAAAIYLLCRKSNVIVEKETRIEEHHHHHYYEGERNEIVSETVRPSRQGGALDRSEELKGLWT